MPSRHVIVDGSNLATEGRSLPSLIQLDQAVREYLAENPSDVVTVVVDASFGHRIDPSEVPMFEGAEAAGELVSPPAGAIGRGDAFLLRIAEKSGATVLSNDSFQEFHGEHAWLFDDGRLVGGKPVPGVGWIFLPRTPVRGQRSREVVKEAKRRKRTDEVAAPPSRESGLDLAASKAKGRAKKVDRAIARATEEAVEPQAKGRRRRRVAGVPPADPVNEPLAFITFIAAHPLGSEVVGTVFEFSSHGAFVRADDARCYLPLSAMGDPPPRRAREVLAKGEERLFVVQALDPQRRGIELALPGYARVAGGPTEETVEAEIHPQAEAAPKRRRREKAPAAAVDGSTPVDDEALVPALVGGPPVPDPAGGPPRVEEVGVVPATAPARRAPGRKAAPPDTAEIETDRQEAAPGAPAGVRKSAPARPRAVKKAPPAEPEPAGEPAKAAAARKAAAPSKVAAARKVAAPSAKRGPAQKAAAKTAPSPTPAAPEKAAAKKAAATSARRTPAKAVAKARAAAKKTGVSEQAGVSERAGAAEQAGPAQKPGPVKKAVPTGANQAKTSPAKKPAATKKAGAAAVGEAALADRPGTGDIPNPDAVRPRKSAPARRAPTNGAPRSPDATGEPQG